MSNESETSPLEQVVDAMVRHDVELIVIGGQAEWIFGSPRVTYDVDLCYLRTPENLQRLAAALQDLHPTLRGAPPDLPFRIDAESLGLGCNFTFNTDAGPLDMLGYVEPIGEYDELLKHVERYRVGAHDLNVIGLEDLIRIKEHICRPKDQESLFQLKAIRKLREAEND